MKIAGPWFASLPLGLLAAASALAVEPVLERDVAVPMRDGVRLQADVLRPAGPGPFPVLVYRTPYGRRAALESYTLPRRAVERGYAVVLQDVRGRHGSEGEFVPYFNEGRDGYDTIEWAAAQPWSSGAVGSFGLSYPGAVQWLAALEAPPHLVAMAPAMTYATHRRFFYFNGVFDLSWIAWTWLNIAPDARARQGLPGPRTEAEAEIAWARLGADLIRRRPLVALHELEAVAPWYFDWLRHPPGDAYWDPLEVAGHYARVKTAALNLSGWHDEGYGPGGAVANHLGLLAARAGETDPRSELVLGPWPHGVGSIGKSRVGERELDPAAALDYDALVLDFMDRRLRRLERKAPARVRAFVMGEGRWLEAQSWPLPGTTERVLYLHGPARAGAPGALVPEPPTERDSASVFRSDPEHPGEDPYGAAAGAHDYRSLVERSDLLVFETPPLAEPMRVVGPVNAEITLACDCRDTDLWVRLFDVAPDGTAFNLTYPGMDVLRASAREGGPQPRLLEPGSPTTLRLDGIFTGNLFAARHRLRIVVTTSWSPQFSHNLHTGESETTSAGGRRATLRVMHDREHPSRVLLPVLAGAVDGAPAEPMP